MKTLVWFRRDLRLYDHRALFEALKTSKEIDLCFVFDTHILDKLKDKKDQRLSFIIDSLKEMEKQLQKNGQSLHILHGVPEVEIPKLAGKLKVEQVLCNKDYEPYAKARDKKVVKNLKEIEIGFQSFKDSVIFEHPQVLSNSGDVYKVFTPYKNKWLDLFQKYKLEDYTSPLRGLSKWENKKNIISHDWYKALGFIETPPSLKAGTAQALKLIKNFEDKIELYHEQRDYPAIDGTSSISPYIRHGNISARHLVFTALKGESKGHEIWLSELIWREFYQMILDTHPQITKESFKPQYDKIKWRKDTKLFKAWCEGKTGVPIVDAAMIHFNNTGLMHNRLRMVVASYLCKILHIDWRKGEEYFAQKLLDFDLAANNGGWQWSSSSGCDAQPYFRIFNPYTQSEKFDKNGDFIKKHLPMLKDFPNKYLHNPSLADLSVQMEAGCVIGKDYPHAIVDYKQAREYTLEVLYAPVKKS